MQQVSVFCDRCDERVVILGRFPIERKIDIEGFRVGVTLHLVAREMNFQTDICDSCVESIIEDLECLAEGIEA